MVYIAADGSVGGKKSLRSKITEFFSTLFNLISLFFTTITNPRALENSNRPSTSTYAQRNGGRSYRAGGSGGSRLGGRGAANIKGVSQLGDAKCAVGGG